ncbi:MAG: dioxygenase [Burkholderiaceae bacterium]
MTTTGSHAVQDSSIHPVVAEKLAALGPGHPRLIELFNAVSAALKQVVREHHVTHEEYCQMVEFMFGVAGEGEMGLICDLILEAAVVESDYAASAGTAFNAEGPYYIAGSPRLDVPCRMPMRPDEGGTPLLFTGGVSDTQGRPLAGARIELWHSTHDGLYSNIDPEVPEWLLRGQFVADEQGRFEVRTIRPEPYEISRHGPVGRMLHAMGRHRFRPAHLHLKVSHPGFRQLTTQIYFDADPYLDSDAANCVHRSLVIRLDGPSQAEAGSAYGFDAPFLTGRYDLVLQPAA